VPWLSRLLWRRIPHSKNGNFSLQGDILDTDVFINLCLQEGLISSNPATGQLFAYKVNQYSRRKRERKPFRTNCGYLMCSVIRNGYRKNLLVHRVIWWDSVGYIPPNKVIDHINGNKADNRLSNLRLISQSENVLAGNVARGERAGGAKLTWITVRAIRFWHNIGLSYSTLARRYGVTKANIGYIIRKKTWIE